MWFQRIVAGLLLLPLAGFSAPLYLNFRTNNQLQTLKTFVEGYVFADAVAACEKSSSTTPFKWNGGTTTRVIGLNSVKLDKYNMVASYTLFADGVFCDFDPIKKKANIGSNFLEREGRSHARIRSPLPRGRWSCATDSCLLKIVAASRLSRDSVTNPSGIKKVG